MTHKNYENQLKEGLDRTNYSSIHSQHDDLSLSDSTSNTFSRSRRSGSLRMELSRSGLYFLLHYLENEFINTIDKKRIYQQDPPTITQKRSILDIANGQQQFAIKDLELTTTSMVILDQLPSTIRRSTINKCLLNESILSSNVKDLDKHTIAKMLPDQDRSLWIRLIDHFTLLLKLHIMNSQTLANKFAPTLLPDNVLYLHDKAKSLLKHILDKLVGTQQTTSSDDDLSFNRKQPVVNLIKTNTNSSSSWLNKIKSGSAINDDFDDSSLSTSTAPKKILKPINSAATSPRTNVDDVDSDLDFYS